MNKNTLQLGQKSISKAQAAIKGLMDEALLGSGISDEKRDFLDLLMFKQVRILSGIEAFDQNSKLTYKSVIKDLYAKELDFEIEKGGAQARKLDKNLFVEVSEEERAEFSERYPERKGEITRYAVSNLENVPDTSASISFADAKEDAKGRAITSLLGGLETTLRVLVQTPHPTETLTREAIAAEKALNTYLAGPARDIALGKDIEDLPEEIATELKLKIRAFSDAVIPPKENMTTAHEASRSNKQSEHLYKAVSFEMNRVLEAIIEIDPDYALNGVPLEMLESLGNLLRAHTWGPGDADSKPQFNAEALRNGIVKLEEAIEWKYMYELATIAASANDDGDKDKAHQMIWRRIDNLVDSYQKHGYSDVTDVESADRYTQSRMESFIRSVEKSGHKAAVGELSSIMEDWKDSRGDRVEIKQSLQKIRSNDHEIFSRKEEISILEAKLEGAGEEKSIEIADRIAKLKQIVLNQEEYKDKHNDFISSAAEKSSLVLGHDKYFNAISKPGYKEHEGFIEDLIDLKSSTDKNGVTFDTDAKGNKTPATIVDSLIVGAQNFAQQSQKGEFRQSSEFFELAQDEIFKVLAKSDIEIDSVEEFLEILSNPNRREEAVKVRAAIYDDLDNVRERAVNIQALAKSNGSGIPEEHKPLVYYSEILEMLKIVSANPDTFPIIQIAECGSHKDILSVQAMLQLMTPAEQKALDPKVGLNTVRPLLEYSKDIYQMSDLVLKAIENPNFLKAQQQRTELDEKKKIFKSEQKLGHYENGEYVSRTVPAEVKNIKVKDLVLNIEDENIQADVVRDIKRRFYLNFAEEKGIDLPANNEALDALASKELRTNSNLRKEWRDYINKADVVEYVVMVAGSDSFKSASSAISSLVDKNYDKTETALVSMGVILGRYIGTGSAMHRNSLIDALTRTRQGLEMRESGEVVGIQNERIKSKLLRRMFGLERVAEETTPGMAMANFGNFLDLDKETTGALEKLIVKSEARVSSYEAVYKGEGFSAFIDNAVPSKLEKFFAYAARPPYRVGSGPASGPDTMRAIGFGQSLNNSQWGAVHLYYYLSEYLNSNSEKGSFANQKDAKDMADIFLKSPKLQDSMNRAAANLILSNSETGWKFSQIGANNIHVTRLSDDKVEIGIEDFDMRKLAVADDNEVNKLESTLKKLNFKGDELKEMMGVLVTSAFSDVQMQDSIKSLVEIYSASAGLHKKYADKKPNSATLLELFNEVSPISGAELTEKKALVERASGKVLEAFEKESRGGKIDRSSEELYASSSVLRNVFENPLETARNPELVKFAEQGTSLAA